VEQQLFPDDGTSTAERPAYRTGYDIERALAASGALCIAGVDEVGRGAWAGPVTVCAAVCTGFPTPPAGLTDSKLLSGARRVGIAAELVDWVSAYAIGEASAAEIDAAGMTVALRRAAIRALEALPVRPDMVLLDGAHDYIGHPWRVRCEVKADLRSVSVAAASVIAKVHRDRYMGSLPGVDAFDFAWNAGYPAPTHQSALAALGPTGHHRMSWSYLDDLPQWRHLKQPRPDIEGQLTLLLCPAHGMAAGTETPSQHHRPTTGNADPADSAETQTASAATAGAASRRARPQL
jgi:ribonuclease HII